ncbi:zinc finger BED domain-containing protein RICESLEEPER 3-like [Rutidosis leptorrhynchoides]|uniref:zinc finger BED domain-containing protein RICESLEEPER 3-like n=1 Tax=Rutidosis leptorrhynchoides TaxID=125765 RepID=UPI003A991F65
MLEIVPYEPMDDGDNEEDVSSCTTGRKRSHVWNYFDKVPLGPDGKQYARCTSCGTLLKAQFGTSNMKRHIPKCFSIGESPTPQKRPRLDQSAYREKVAISIIKHGYPFSYVEHEATRDLHRFLHSGTKTITRDTVKAEVMKIFEREKAILKHKLESITCKICFTSNLWTSITTDSYMSLTAHYVDDSWALRKEVLSFRVIPPPHSGTLLAEYMINILKDWGMEKKVFTITLDDASYDTCFVDTLKTRLTNNGLLCKGDFMNICCGAHVLNLIVQSALEVIQSAIEKVRKSVKYVRGSETRKTRFAECIKHLSLQCGRHVRQDIVTRWNSTFLMLDCALVYQRAYERLQSVDNDFKTCPTQAEWTRIETIKKFLEPFYVMTTLFSRSHYPTSNLYFHNVWRIQRHIQKEMKNSDPIISKMAHEMKVKFDKYWESYSKVLSFAVILDPRYKVKMVEYCFDKLGIKDKHLKAKVESVVNGLKKLYKEYQTRSDVMHDSSVGGGSSEVGKGVLDESDESDDLDGFDSYMSKFSNSNEKSELDEYLVEPPLDRKLDFNILHYWRDNQGRYPQLARMARDVLSIPITTVFSDSSFSIGGQILSKYRSSLLSENVEALLCTRDWLFDSEDELDEDETDVLTEDIEAMISTLGSSTL